MRQIDRRVGPASLRIAVRPNLLKSASRRHEESVAREVAESLCLLPILGGTEEMKPVVLGTLIRTKESDACRVEERFLVLNLSLDFLFFPRVLPVAIVDLLCRAQMHISG